MNNNILLIDDNTSILETLSLWLRTRLQDWDILTARNGNEGAEIMSSVPVSLVVTDLQMPGMDGYGVIEFRNGNYPLVPLIVMTGNLTPDVREQLRGLHVSACVEKPFDFETLFLHVVGALGVDPEADAVLAHAASIVRGSNGLRDGSQLASGSS
ncbi:MAG TPA: response regulator [Nitrospirota bacterium]|nr:response regulator [Nitrospirota bacterium]